MDSYASESDRQGFDPGTGMSNVDTMNTSMSAQSNVRGLSPQRDSMDADNSSHKNGVECRDSREDGDRTWSPQTDSLYQQTGQQRGFYDQQLAEGGEVVSSDKLNHFRIQLLQLSRQKDGLMPRPDGTFPSDWLGLAWDYQALAEEVIRSAWPCLYPEGLLPCVNQQVEYLKRRLEEFPSIPVPEKDKFQRLYILAALGIIAKMKLVTFCWTFVELKHNEQRAALARGGQQSSLRQSLFKARRLSSMQVSPQTAVQEDVERTEYTTRSGRRTHRTSMKPEKT